MKKILLVILMITSITSVFAKSLVYIPTAVSCDGIEASFAYDTKDKNNMFNLQGGLNGYEISLTNYSNKFDADKFMPTSKTIINAQWQIMPDVNMIPAIAVGAKDLTSKINKTPAFYAVATKNFSDFIPFPLLEKLSVTAGVSHQSIGVFGGLDVKLGFVYATAETYKNGTNFSAGLTFFDDKVKIGWQRFNKNNYITVNAGITF